MAPGRSPVLPKKGDTTQEAPSGSGAARQGDRGHRDGREQRGYDRGAVRGQEKGGLGGWKGASYGFDSGSAPGNRESRLVCALESRDEEATLRVIDAGLGAAGTGARGSGIGTGTEVWATI